MAAGSTYPVDIATLDGVGATGTVRVSGQVQFTDSTNQPVPSAPPITSGTLPNAGAWVSGTAKVNPVSRQITVNVEFVTDATNNAATCAIAISPDNVTYTTIGTPGCAAAINNLGAATFLSCVTVPKGWYIKVTFARGTVAASIYY